jgi:hypothetical protein
MKTRRRKEGDVVLSFPPENQKIYEKILHSIISSTINKSNHTT